MNFIVVGDNTFVTSNQVVLQLSSFGGLTVKTDAGDFVFNYEAFVSRLSKYDSVNDYLDEKYKVITGSIRDGYKEGLSCLEINLGHCYTFVPRY